MSHPGLRTDRKHISNRVLRRAQVHRVQRIDANELSRKPRHREHRVDTDPLLGLARQQLRCAASGRPRFWCATPSPWRPKPSVKSSLMPCLAQKSRLTHQNCCGIAAKKLTSPAFFFTRRRSSSQVLAWNASPIHVGLVDVLQEGSANISGQVASRSAVVTSTRNIGPTPEACAATDALKASSPLILFWRNRCRTWKCRRRRCATSGGHHARPRIEGGFGRVSTKWMCQL